MKSKVTLIRHGETEWNRSGKQQGIKNSNLTQTGIRQAEATADALGLFGPFEAMYSSHLGRATHTAALIGAKIRISFLEKDCLQERNLGILQGLTIEEFKRRYPAAHTGFASRDPDYIIPEGESSRHRYDRGNSCIGELAARHPGQHILVITHGGIIDGVMRKIMGVPLEIPRMYSLFNCSINTISISQDRWRLLSWGEIHHLKGIGSLDDH